MINAIGRAFFSPREDLRQVREKFAGGMALVITVLYPLQTYCLRLCIFQRAKKCLKLKEVVINI